MTMHGMFWRFPKDFSAKQMKGILPRSTYLKVVGDFTRWNDRVVLGCDDTAKSEFLNKRKAKGELAQPHSHSNLWFLKPEQLDHIGPVIGRGAVWLNDPVEAKAPSEPFLIDGFAKRAIHFATDKPTSLTLEVDQKGTGEWTPYQEIKVDGYAWKEIDPSLDAVWMRVTSSEKLGKATAWFHLGGDDDRAAGLAPEKFEGVARLGETKITGGLLHASYDYDHKLRFAAETPGEKIGFYTLDGSSQLTAKSSDEEFVWMQKNAAIPSREGVITEDEASVIYTDDDGQRFRLPANPAWKEDACALGNYRLCREVATERDLFNTHGTFFELPANNAGGFNRVRPVSSHNLAIKDYCSFRGLLVLSGVNLKSGKDNRHIIRSDDGKTGLWVGAIDDIWTLGKPIGTGGPWKGTKVSANQPSDPYLMTGYDKKSLALESTKAGKITAEIDLSGMGDWQPYKTFEIKASEALRHEFPEAFQAYWIRFRSDTDTTATAQLTYE